MCWVQKMRLENAIFLYNKKSGQFKKRGRKKNLLPNAQNSFLFDFFCGLHELMSKAKDAYALVLLKMPWQKVTVFWIPHTPSQKI